jgi:hypothetical protein
MIQKPFIYYIFHEAFLIVLNCAKRELGKRKERTVSGLALGRLESSLQYGKKGEAGQTQTYSTVVLQYKTQTNRRTEQTNSLV